MTRESFDDLAGFLAVARERSFTRAAAKLGTSPSALSHTINRLEARVGVRLLMRTTRSVAPTEAGARMLDVLNSALGAIADALASARELRDRPSGTIRITTVDHAAHDILWPALERFLPLYPDVNVEIVIEQAFADIVAEGFDAGVRLGESIAKDMVAVRIGPDLRMAVVGAPAYFARNPKPRTPQDLARHACINLRLSTAGGLYVWELQKGSRELHVRVDGRLVFNDVRMVLKAAEQGFGLACVPDDHVAAMIAGGTLVRALEEWCPPFPGYHLYYPSRRRPSAAFSLLVEALRYRG